MEEAEASKVAAEEEEAIKAEVPLEEDSKPEVHHLVKIIKIINIRTSISRIMYIKNLFILPAKPTII